MEFILHEILKYKLNNLHALIFLQVDCFYFACYSYTLGPTNLGHNKFGYDNFGYHNFSHKFRKFLVYNNFSHIV